VTSDMRGGYKWLVDAFHGPTAPTTLKTRHPAPGIFKAQIALPCAPLRSDRPDVRPWR
jgi:hypothetical protein